MRVNTRIIVSALILMAAGVYNIYVANARYGVAGRPSVTRIIVGGYMLAIIVSVVDLVSPEAGYLGGLIMFVAVITMLYTVLPDLLSRIAGRNTQPQK